MLHDAIGRRITSLRVSVTDRCNLRCRYCMPENGVEFIPHTEILHYEEIERIVRLVLHMGVTKIRLTGGEPLIRKGLVDFAARLRRLPRLRKLSLTTNAILLAQYATVLKDAGIDYLNISLDTLNQEKFFSITRFNHIDTVLKGIQAAKNAGFAVIKVNVVSMKGFNDDELFDFVNFANQHDVVVRFIEHMPFSGNTWQQGNFLPSQALKARLEERYTLIPQHDTPSAPAKTYRISGHAGRIGFISSVSENFCAFCNRLRLTSDGSIRPCLHGDIEVDIKGPMRRGAHDQEIAQLIQQAVEKKPVSHQNFLDTQYHTPVADRAMVKIGG